MLNSCPVCGSTDVINYVFKPYKTCVVCSHTYQQVSPPKIWLNKGESNSGGDSGIKMNDHERAVNKSLAKWLYSIYKPSKMLDIGSGYPYFAQCFKEMDVDAIAIDGAFKDDLIDNDLDVNTVGLDWENDEIIYNNIDMVTMIHVFEHFYNPSESLRKIYNVLNDEGVVYIRLPNKNVSGIERDHTNNHVKIHPNIYGTESLKKIFLDCGFHLIWMGHQEGVGQTSCIFRKRPPKLSLFMIVKNEENNIRKCLESVEPFCDEMIVLDTGSTDNTMFEVSNFGAFVFSSKKFNSKVPIKKFNFAEARNEAMSLATGDWMLWMDADDVFVGEPKFSPLYDTYNVIVESGNTDIWHYRFVRNGWTSGFVGAVHEVLNIDKCRQTIMGNIKIKHDPSIDNNKRTERNLAILKEEYAKDRNDKRTLFYLANAYMESGKYKEAISKNRKYINLNGSFHDELVIAYQNIANCYYLLGYYKEALRHSFKGLALDDSYAEFYCRIGESYINLRKYKFAILYFSIAADLEYPNTRLWYRKEMYDLVPKCGLSYCYEQLGYVEKAIEFAVHDKRREQLQKILDNKNKPILELERPGALGDIIMTTPALKEIRKKYNDYHIRFVCHPSMKDVLQNNPYIDEIIHESGKYDIKFYFSYPMKQGYPNVPLKKHLVEYFADCADVELSENWKCYLNLGNYEIDDDSKFITFAVKTGWSKYKEWSIDRWEELIKRIRIRYPDIIWVQIGAKDEPAARGSMYMCGNSNIIYALRLLEKSILFVGLDSVFNHASNALNVPAVIMFGSTNPVGSGYKENTNLVANLDCNPCYIENENITVHKKSPCPINHKCMKDFMTVDLVESAVIGKLLKVKYNI